MWASRPAPTLPALSQTQPALLPPNAPRRPLQLTSSAGGQSRPFFSPRLSSLNLSPRLNASTSTVDSPKLTVSSGLKQEILQTPETSDSISVLEDIIGTAPFDGKPVYSDYGAATGHQVSLINDVNLDGMSLRNFVGAFGSQDQDLKSSENLLLGTAGEFEQEASQLEELRHSISSCDRVLASVGCSLAGFQNNLFTVSSEIENLQKRSSVINNQLRHRRSVEKILGPKVEDISVPPHIILKLAEGQIDQEWVAALATLEKRLSTMDHLSKTAMTRLEDDDIRPLLEDLTKIAIERIRDFFVSQIRALRSPNINAQIIQQRAFISYRDLFTFMFKHQSQLAEDIAQAYNKTMRWYYLSYFNRYKQALDKLHVYSIEKQDTLGGDPSNGKNTSSQNELRSPNPLSVDRRLHILAQSEPRALPLHIAMDMKTPVYIETPFHAFTTAVTENASAEFTFLTSFFPINGALSSLSRRFFSIFEPVFELGHSLTRQLTGETADCLGLLLCIRITQRHAFCLQRRKCPVAESWINGTNMLLWPRFQSVMDIHIDSLKRATASVYSSGRATLSLTANKTDNGRGNVAPSPITQRFGQLLQGLLLLSSSENFANASSGARLAIEGALISSDTEPVARSLQRLRSEVENFLSKMAKGMGAIRGRKFLANNYNLILTIIGDTSGTLAREERGWFAARLEEVETT